MTILLSLKLRESQASYDHDSIISRLRKTFPKITVLEGDQLLKRAEHAQTVDMSVSDEYKQQIVAELLKNAKQYGPATAFFIPTTEGVGGRNGDRSNY